MCQFQETTNYLEIAFTSATILIALFNIFFTVYIFRTKIKKSDSNIEQDRRIQLFKTLILDHNLKHFYTCCDDLEKELSALQESGLSDDKKKDIYSKSQDHFITLRRKFTDTLLAVDYSLYKSVLKSSDDLQTYLSSMIFDNGYNLSHRPKYDEIITERLSTAKTDILKILFTYRG